jgi:16S rRNA (uracil1498-N3)-methyltransferase
MQHFFLEPQAILGDQVHFPAKLSKQILQVLRLKPGIDQVKVLDNSGSIYLVQLQQSVGKNLTGQILSQAAGSPGPRFELCMAFSLSRREKISWILQKGTELGVHSFRPYVSMRSIVRKSETNARIEHLQAVIREAAEQSERSKLPLLYPTASYAEVLRESAAGGLNLLASERRVGIGRLRAEYFSGGIWHGTVLVGPEGGLTPEEAETAGAQGFQAFSLGSQILRMETACIAAAAIILHESEKLAEAQVAAWKQIA